MICPLDQNFFRLRGVLFNTHFSGKISGGDVLKRGFICIKKIIVIPVSIYVLSVYI
jgi:hypothetical protein